MIPSSSTLGISISNLWICENEKILARNSIKYFNLTGIGKSSSKLDMTRILSMNEYYIKNLDEKSLFDKFLKFCEIYKNKIEEDANKKLLTSISFLKNKARTLEDIYNNSKYIIQKEIIINDVNKKFLDEKSKKIISDIIDELKNIEDFKKENLEIIINNEIKKNNSNFKTVGQPLRIALTGSRFGPGIYDILTSLGKDEVIKRLAQIR